MHSNRHIVSRVSWDTSFDHKEDAVALQQRISRWCSYKLQREVETVFDRLCPPGQTWRIQTLNLNLGTINFDNLESELSVFIKEQLNELLEGLIKSDFNGVNHEIEVLETDVSNIQLLSFFLLNGTVNWNSSGKTGSINKLIKNLLIDHFEEVIDLIKHTGVTHENVRKRIAWQIQDTNLKEIVRGLEPVNHTQILDFSEELTKYQQKQSLISSGSREFRKNTWLWIFNYLLVEKGTLFNRVAYMRSSIRQMANHYNLGYDQLLKSISMVLETINKKQILRPDFITTLKILSDENKINSKGLESTGLDGDYWEDFKSLFEIRLKRTTDQKRKLNELTHALYAENEKKFSKLINSFEHSPWHWEYTMDDLLGATREIFIKAIVPSKANILIQTIHVIEKLIISSGLKTRNNLVWKTAITFVREHKSTTFEGAKFLELCIMHLAHENSVSSYEIAQHLAGSGITGISKTFSTLSVLSNIKHLFPAESKKSELKLSTFRAGKLVDELHSILNTVKSVAEYEKVQEALFRFMCTEPSAFFSVIKTYPDKPKLASAIKQTMDWRIARLIVKRGNLQLYELVQALQQCVKDMNLDISSRFFLEKIWLECLLVSPYYFNSRPDKIIEKILRDYTYKLNAAHLEIFTRELDSHFNTEDQMLQTLKKNILISVRRNEKWFSEFSIEKIIRLTKILQVDKKKISAILSVHFANSFFKRVRKTGNSDGRVLLNYFIPGVGEKMQPLINKMERIILTKQIHVGEHNLKEVLADLYWKTILQSGVKVATVSDFERSFLAAVFFNFSFKKSNGRVPVLVRPMELLHIGGPAMKERLRAEGTEIFQLVSEAIKNASPYAVTGGGKINLDGLLLQAVEMKPAAVRRVFYETEITNKRINNLSAALEFYDFALRLSVSFGSDLREDAENLLILNEITTYLSSEQLAKRLNKNYWKYFWTLIRKGSWSEKEFLAIAGNMFSQVAMNKKLETETVIGILEKQKINLTPKLKRVLTELLPKFSVILADDLVNGSIAELQRCEKKGLLEHLTHDFLENHQLPFWFIKPSEMTSGVVLKELMQNYPLQFYKVLKSKILTQIQIEWFWHHIDVEVLIGFASKLNRMQKHTLNIILKFYFSLAALSVKEISGKELQYILFGMILRATANGNWQTISLTTIWSELLWEAALRSGLNRTEFTKVLDRMKDNFPPAMCVALEIVLKKDREQTRGTSKKNGAPLIPELRTKALETSGLSKTGIPVKNAGLVLLNSYVPLLFERLKLINNERKFVSVESQLDAVHYLQYLVTGLHATEESYLPLNKILCGLPLATAIRDGIETSEEERKLISGLIKAAIGFWPSAGDTSINGFRGNWLVRDGLILEHEDKWELTVEKRVYDLLIQKSPFSFSIIKFPWMLKPLHVNWPC